MVSFEPHSVNANMMSGYSGAQLWYSGAFPNITMALVCCQQQDRQVLSTEYNCCNLLTLVTAVCLQHRVVQRCSVILSLLRPFVVIVISAIIIIT